MDMTLSPDDLAFQQEVREFLRDKLPERLRHAADLTPGVFVDPEIGLEWQAILNARGWAAPHWPQENGGPGWTPVQRYIFDKECALAGTPAWPCSA